MRVIKYGQMVRRKKAGNCGGAFEGRLRGWKSRKEEDKKEKEEKKGGRKWLRTEVQANTP